MTMYFPDWYVSQLEGSNAGRGLGSFVRSLMGGGATQPLNPPAPPASPPQAPSLNAAMGQGRGLIPSMLSAFGYGQSPGDQNQGQGVSQAPINQLLSKFGVSLPQIADNANLGLQSAASGGALSGLFPGGI
jgi:hypothetical protein